MDKWRTNSQRSVKKKKTFRLKNLIGLLYRFFLIILVLVLLQSVVKNIIMVYRLADNQKKVQMLKLEQAQLEKQQKETKTDFFVEKMAREKLDMLKSGEIILKLQSNK